MKRSSVAKRLLDHEGSEHTASRSLTRVGPAWPHAEMRLTFVLVLSLSIAACAESTPPPEAPPAPSAEPVAAAPPALPASAAPAPAPGAGASAPGAPVRTPATLAGAIGGKPFHAVAACVAGSKDAGRVYVEIYDAKDVDVTTGCGMMPAGADARKIGVVLPWSDGAKLDVASLKPSKDGPLFFVMSRTANPTKMDRKDAGKELKPTGTIEVLKAPAQKGSVGRIKLNLAIGKDKLGGEVDVDVIAEGLH